MTVGARTKRSPRAKAKPAPRKKPGPKPPRPDKIARILIDAEEFTDAIAAKRHSVGERTVRLYRSAYADDPIVAELCRSLRERLKTGWIDKIRTARSVGVDAVVEKLIDPESTLRDRTIALRELRETAHAYELLHDDTKGDHHGGGAAAPGGEGEAGEGAAQG